MIWWTFFSFSNNRFYCALYSLIVCLPPLLFKHFNLSLCACLWVCVQIYTQLYTHNWKELLTPYRFYLQIINKRESERERLSVSGWACKCFSFLHQTNTIIHRPNPGLTFTLPPFFYLHRFCEYIYVSEIFIFVHT